LLDSNPVDNGVWRVLEGNVYKIRIIDLNELKQRLETECLTDPISVKALWQI